LEMGGHGHALIALTVLPVVRSQHPLPYTPNTELDNHYLKYHADKARRIKERGKKCCHTGGVLGGFLEMGGHGHALIALTVLPVVRSQHPLPLCAYLPERYPSMFTKTTTGITNKVTNETFNITQRPLPEVRGLLEMGGHGHALIALTVLPVVRSQHPLPLVLYLYPERRARQPLSEIPRRQSTPHRRAREKMLPYSTR
jgi:hypothetical protein